MIGTNQQPVLSVIVPTYDRPGKTNRALRSILSQDFADLEVIVVDDGSPTPFMLAGDLATDPRIRVLTQPVNRGAAAARNTGLVAARAPWLAFLDSDDLWAPATLASRLEQAAHHYRTYGNPFAIYACAVALLDETGHPLSIRTPRPATALSDFAGGCWFYPGSAVILRREPIIDRLGLQDESLPRLEDLDWFLRLALLGGELVIISEVGALIERSHKPALPAVTASTERLFAKWREVACRNELPKNAWRNLEAYLLVETAASRWYHGKYRSALLDLARSLIIVPRGKIQLSPGWETQTPAPVLLTGSNRRKS